MARRSFQRSYSRWIREVEPKKSELDRQRSNVDPFPYCPRVAAVVRVSNSNLDSNLVSIRSVIDQTYGWWQLRLVVDQVQETDIRDLAARFEEDDRIQVVLMPQSNQPERGFAVVLNLENVEFAAVLYPGDLLAPNALWEVARVLNDRPEVDLIYSDQDRMDPPGHIRSNPWFKPDWSPELLLSVNYLYPAFIKMSLIEGTPDIKALLDYETAWGFFLKCTREASHIVHIPRVLCHVGSGTEERKPLPVGDVRAPASGVETVGRHVQNLGVVGAEAQMTALGSIRVVWPSKTALVSIIIPTRDNSRWLKRCIDSLQNLTMKPPYEIILVDNQSQEAETRRLYERLELDNRIRVVPFEQPFNFSAANNTGANQSLGDLLLFLNDDVEIIDSGWLEEMARWAEWPEIGVVGAKLIYPDLTIQHAGIILGMGGHAGHVLWGAREGESGPLGSTEWYRNFMAVTGACMMIPRKTFNQVGGCDERYQIAFGDVDICLRIIQQGYRVLYTPFARLIHHEGATRGRLIPAQDLDLAYREFLPHIRSGDPYFNPNLSYKTSYLQLAFEPEDRVAQLERIGRFVAAWFRGYGSGAFERAS